MVRIVSVIVFIVVVVALFMIMWPFALFAVLAGLVYTIVQRVRFNLEQKQVEKTEQKQQKMYESIEPPNPNLGVIDAEIISEKERVN